MCIRDRDTEKCSESNWRPLRWPPLIFKTCSWGRFGHQGTLQEWEKAPPSLLRSRARPQNRVTAFLQWIMSPRALLHCKYAIIRAVARGTVSMQSFGLASIYVAPSVDLESENCFFKKHLKLEAFLSAFLLPSKWPRDTVQTKWIELATIFVAPSDF